MIPKIIHYCWFGGEKLPERDKKNIENWKNVCPDYQIIEWNESNYDTNKCTYMRQAYERHKLGFVPDYARLDIIYKYGGFYFDTDVELIKNLDFLTTEHCIMGFESFDKINHGHGFAAEPGNETIRELRDVYDSLLFVNQDGSLNLMASPHYISEFMKKKGAILNNTKQRLGDVLIVPSDYFCPKDMFTGKINLTKNTVSIHHFNMSWMDDRELSKVENVKKLSNVFGKSIAYNIVEFWYNLEEKGIKYSLEFLLRKIQKRGKGK